jgi:hypothetical protein
MSSINITIVATAIVPIVVACVVSNGWKTRPMSCCQQAYFHCVFTVPHELNALTMGNRKLMFDLLFEASSYTVLKLCNDEQWLGATPGFISVSYTLGGRTSRSTRMCICIVSGGGVKR